MRRLGLALACGTALALASCSSTTQTMTQQSYPTSSGGPSFSQSGGVNVAYTEFKNSAFPYNGEIPPDDDHSQARPFLDVNANGKLGHSSMRNGVLWQDSTYNDRHVLIAASPEFNPNSPGVIVVYFHGNQATLLRDVAGRQQTPQQVAQSPLNAVLLAPQMAVNALDSSAGNFWRPGAFAQFLDEADGKLADEFPGTSRGTFRRMPVVVVAYSGGYMPAAYSLAEGGAGERVRGVILLDALYGEVDKFERWIEQARGGAFFLSAYSGSTHDENAALRAKLQRDGVAVENDLPNDLSPGVVAFVDSGDVNHDDFGNHAWTRDPLADALSRVDR